MIVLGGKLGEVGDVIHHFRSDENGRSVLARPVSHPIPNRSDLLLVAQGTYLGIGKRGDDPLDRVTAVRLLCHNLVRALGAQLVL